MALVAANADSKQRRQEKQASLDGENHGEGAAIGAGELAAEIKGDAAEQPAQAEGNGLCCPPHPMRMPALPDVPRVASAIIVPMAATANMPFMKPSRKTLGATGQWGASVAARLSRASAAAEPRQPTRMKNLGNAGNRRPSAKPPRPTTAMPIKMPECCTPDSFVDSPGVMPNNRPAKGSRIRSCVE